jgi:hypothetical protein
MDPHKQRPAIDRVDAGRRAASKLMMVLDDGDILVTAAIPDWSRTPITPCGAVFTSTPTGSSRPRGGLPSWRSEACLRGSSPGCW